MQTNKMATFWEFVLEQLRLSPEIMSAFESKFVWIIYGYFDSDCLLIVIVLNRSYMTSISNRLPFMDAFIPILLELITLQFTCILTYFSHNKRLRLKSYNKKKTIVMLLSRNVTRVFLYKSHKNMKYPSILMILWSNVFHQ